VMNRDILNFMKELDVTEIHSYNAELGFRVFKDALLSQS